MQKGLPVLCRSTLKAKRALLVYVLLQDTKFDPPNNIRN